MDIKLHLNATTTPKIRAYLQKSDKSDLELAEQLGISVQTVRRWRNRQDVNDRSHRPKKINRTLSFEQEYLICYLRKYFALSLDELLEAGRNLINQRVSRAVISRCLKKYGLNIANKKDLPSQVGCTFLAMFPLPKEISKEEDYLFILIEKLTGYISCACLDRKLQRQQSIINYFKSSLPYEIQEIELAEDITHHAIVQAFAKKTKVVTSTLILQSAVNFEQDFIRLVSGYYTDSRLGFDAQLLRYEEYLNKHLKRNRLKKLSPYDYLMKYRR
ncbi:helix-turn-helix domain-containing protein [Histophilus somni]|uniref:Helix-turn-helix domain-containing protein n=1 Tax=Histophilus somni TaxID=731 RepID=A0A9Q6Z079_HISSO|nr:helix-turn-helix domain-containing protein [Histophilus somni]ARU65567.1 hypothetical protein BTV18_08695 [Histophilus somni]ARU67436.1 hypothetical protein BTV19_09135 [Histophilus somni]ARU69317.1 hypothetical protein BTV16_09150 [Histophilus somni]ARU71194.1 hypothetical protein BTV20_09155 [Histophilus somni]ARU73065.1 hypothetical protein BTV17_09130 [Histophilus somni]